MKTVATSGYFDPLHVGHLECLELAKELGDKLVVIVNSDFQYNPSMKTSKYIWQYLSSSNLLVDPDSIDLEDEDKFNLFEWAAANDSYNKKKLFGQWNCLYIYLLNVVYYITFNKRVFV